MKNMVSRFQNSNLKIQIVFSVSSFLLYGYASAVLDASYAASRFPVPYFIGQTSFDDNKIKGWYQYMIDSGTFNLYFQTQLIDFFFIATVVLGGFFIWTLVANFHGRESFFRKWGYTFACALPLAGLFDVLENLVSFFMIANPQNFSNEIAVLYSTFAAIKFGFWGVALVWLLLSFVALGVSSAKKLFRAVSLNQH